MTNLKTIQIQDLGEGIVLNTPIKIIIDSSDGDPMGYYEPLELYTISRTIPEMEKEIKADILGLWDLLRDHDESRLGELPLKWKKHLEKIIWRGLKAPPI